MPLFGKSRKTFGAEIDAVITDLGLLAEHRRQGRFTTLSDGTLLFLAYLDEDHALAGYAAADERSEPEGLNEVLAANLEPTLVWSVRNDDDDEQPMGIRFILPFETFDRGATLLAVGAAAQRLGDDAVAARAAQLRTPADPERTRVALDAGLDTLDAAQREAVEAFASDDGEVVLIRRELAYNAGPRDVAMQRWLLAVSDGRGARLGLTPIPGQRAFAVATVPGAGLQPGAVAWAVDQVRQLADAYEDAGGGA